jgi:hypothetical protein
MEHKFKPGQIVMLERSTDGSNRQGRFEIVRQLPSERGINHYRLKSVMDGHERVVMESEIS